MAISVTDDGRGVSADQLPDLFKKFTRIDSEDGKRKIAGDGLGLAICKGIVETHGGRIWAESDGLGHGTRFTFTIPVFDEAAPDTTADPAQDPTNAGRVVKQGEMGCILAVDDDPQILRYVRNMLSATGYTPIVTGDPDEFLHLFEMEQPDLVLLDVVLPRTDGFKLMKRIREVSDVPVIFLSGSGGEETIVRALSMGADDYIVKPFSPTELVARIEASLRKRAADAHPKSREPYRVGNLIIDYAVRGVTVSNCPVQLTATEYKLLFELSINAGRSLTHDQLLQRVWGPEYSGEGHLVRAFVRKLRHKLGDDASNPTYIFTEINVGYHMAKPQHQNRRQQPQPTIAVPVRVGAGGGTGTGDGDGRPEPPGA